MGMPCAEDGGGMLIHHRPAVDGKTVSATAAPWTAIGLPLTNTLGASTPMMVPPANPIDARYAGHGYSFR